MNMRGLRLTSAAFLILSACSEDTSIIDATVLADASPRFDADESRDASEAEVGPEDRGLAPDAAEDASSDAGELDSGDSGADLCGDGAVDPGEDCDDGNRMDDLNGCSADCRDTAVCGNGVVESLFEACDFGVDPCCAATCDGPGADGVTCDGCGASACGGCFQGSCTRLPESCREILAMAPTSTDGVYLIDPGRSRTASTSFSAFCDMTTDGGGWTLIFKKSASVFGDTHAAWTGAATGTRAIELLDRGADSMDYVSPIIAEYWRIVSEARVEVVTGTTAVRFMHFDGEGSTSLSWFAPERWTASSWTDLPTAASWQGSSSGRFFSIRGNDPDRRFYINRNWGGCPADRGWLLISSGDFCSWERSAHPNDILYAEGPTHALANSSQFARADALLVFVR
ncbi:MAG: hypothetical protein HY791_32645 [Deltaproteobacteria bacterium]|nr:hypothetical protein [Deltaproteobacteria bacterium]